jgi:phage-related protein
MKLVDVVNGLFRIVAICDDQGLCPLEAFLGSFVQPEDAEARKMMALLRWSAREGPPRNREKSSPLGDEIYEFKTTDLRVLYFYDENRLIVCSHGFQKKSRKCPPGERRAAISSREAYFEAKRKGKLQFRDE